MCMYVKKEDRMNRCIKLDVAMGDESFGELVNTGDERFMPNEVSLIT